MGAPGKPSDPRCAGQGLRAPCPSLYPQGSTLEARSLAWILLELNQGTGFHAESISMEVVL